MARRPFSDVVIDIKGKPLGGASVTVKVHATGLVAVVYATEVATEAAVDGKITAATDGTFIFWIDDANYRAFTVFDFVASMPGYADKTRTVAI